MMRTSASGQVRSAVLVFERASKLSEGGRDVRSELRYGGPGGPNQRTELEDSGGRDLEHVDHVEKTLL